MKTKTHSPARLAPASPALPFAFVLALAALAFSAAPASFAAADGPSVTGPAPSQTVVQSADARRAQYLARVNEVIDWRASLIKPGDASAGDFAGVAALLARGENTALCNATVIELSKHIDNPGPFWMFPAVCVAFLGRDTLSPEARAALRSAWSETIQVRGDTENHWCMYYTSLYLMSELYPDEPGATWFNGKSTSENLAESRGYLMHWMDIVTTIGIGEFTCSHYIGEYAIPMLYLATWAKDPAMRQRGRMMLEWLLADQFASSQNGVLHAPNARTDDTAVVEHWNCLTSALTWMLAGNTPPTPGYGGWGIYFAVVAKNFELPEVIYRIAIDRDDAGFTQRDLKHSRRRWRYSDELYMPVYKTNYTRKDYAVGSYQGGLADPIQTHVWDVTWAVPDPRGAHNTMFSMHPISSGKVMQTYFTELPDQMTKGVTKQGKPSYDSPDKILGCSPYEQVFQDKDTIIALYNIPEGTRFPHINGYFSRDLRDVVEDPSGWIFAKGGNTYLAYRPLAGYTWQTLLGYKNPYDPSQRAAFASLFNFSHPGDGDAPPPVPQVDRILQSPHLKNGTIVQAASAGEYKTYAAFQAAIKALPLTFALDPVPTVTLTTLRGSKITFTYDQPPVLNGQPVDYGKWKLYEGDYLNAKRGSRKLTLTHGSLERTLDFNTLSITDRVKQ